ncbi:hypothetical protein KUA24_124 [Vibrio phage HNL01]|nr:hypothetical protein KUA24_124 [Vibrio phage HNL01]
MGNDVEIIAVYKGELISRKVAVVEGLTRYFTGKSCKHGHVAQRETGSGQCIECKRLRTQKWRDKPDSEKFVNERNAKELPSQETLNELFIYDEGSGKLYWKHRNQQAAEDSRVYKSWVTRFSGKEAGHKHYANRYLEVRLSPNQLYKVHRVIWKMQTGVDPLLKIDHINGDRSDNSWDNLRLATDQENARNSKSFSGCGFKGASYDIKLGWIAQWCVQDTNFREYGFATAEDAARCYDKNVYKLYGEFAKLNFPEEVREYE